MSDRLRDLSGLDAAIRLKAHLLQELATTDSGTAEALVSSFISDVDRLDLDATALMVLLADLREQIRLMAGASDARANREPLHGEAPHFSRRDVIEQFRRDVLESLTSSGGQLTGCSPLVRQAVSFIERHYGDRLTLDRLAQAVGRSKRHLGTLFRSQMGQTMHAYLTQVRLRHATALIRQGEKIEAVSLLVGYRSKKNFYRHFKTYVGATPVEYKRSLDNRKAPRER